MPSMLASIHQSRSRCPGHRCGRLGSLSRYWRVSGGSSSTTRRCWRQPPVRCRQEAGKPFEKSRKLGRAHQNVLIFVNGDPVAATAAVGLVEFGALDLGGEHEDSEQPRTPVEEHGGIWLIRYVLRMSSLRPILPERRMA